MQKIIDMLIDGDRNHPARSVVMLDKITAFMCPGLGSAEVVQSLHIEPPENVCQVCGAEKILVDHYEYDGVTAGGSYEPYYVCPFSCNEAEADDKVVLL